MSGVGEGSEEEHAGAGVAVMARGCSIEILRGGGLSTGVSTSTPSCAGSGGARHDLFHAHIGGMDTMARALLAAASILESGELDRFRDDRYASWSSASRS